MDSETLPDSWRLLMLYGRDFAQVYSKYGYNEFSARVAELLPGVLAKLRVRPHQVLDLPCGEGTFAIRMAKRGYRTTGVDRSSAMLRLGRRKAREARLSVRFIESDVRSLRFHEEFDLATSWYDSLNYLLTLSDLKKTFACVFRALQTGGDFLFAGNTPGGLFQGWQKDATFVVGETKKGFFLPRSRLGGRERLASR